MTPKEKADELYEAFFYSIPSFTDEGQLEHKTAKQCALIAVDEILDLYAIHYTYYTLEFKYWQEVKKQLEKI